MVSSAVSEIYYTGNGSTVTSYAVPFVFIDSDHVKAQKLTAGTGTVTIADGVVTFSSAQSTLSVGSRFRVSGVVYVIDTRTSDTSFTITDHTVDVASSAFHIPDDATQLTEGSTFTLTGESGSASVTTNPAIASTALLRIYREVPYTQPTEFGNSGPIQGATIEQSFDRVGMQVQQLATALENSAVVVAASNPTDTSTDTTTFANAAARAAATPTRIGQQGVQLDTNVEYYGTATTAGAWQAIAQSAPAKTYATHALTEAASPDVVGQLAWTARRWRPYLATSTSAGGFDPIDDSRICAYGTWEATPWREDEELIAGQRRWAGVIGRKGLFENGIVAVNTPGVGTLTMKIHLVADPNDLTGVTREVTQSALTLAAGINAKIISRGGDADFTESLQAGGPAGAEYGSARVTGLLDRVEVEIVSVGTAVSSVTTTAGSAISTIPNIHSVNVITGTQLTGLGRDEPIWIIAIRGNGTVIYTHAAAVTAAGNGSITYKGRTFVRGALGLSAVAGDRTITVDATTAALVQIGDITVGDSVAPDTWVVGNNGTNTLTLNQPLTGDASQVAFINLNRPPIVHFTDISEPDTETNIAVPSVKFLQVGDTAKGTYISPTARITAIDISTPAAPIVTISPAISGGAITEITFTYPQRSASGSAGATTFTVDNATGLKNAVLVQGPGVPENTFVTDVTGTTVTIDTPLSLAITTENVLFNRDIMQVSGATTVAEDGTITLPYAASTTPFEVGMEVTGAEIRAGTFITSISGSTIEVSPAPHSSNVAANVRVLRTPAWKGLHISLQGPHTPYLA